MAGRGGSVPDALVREVGSGLADCQLTHVDRTSIDSDRARIQHQQYVDALRSLSFEVTVLPNDEDHPDGAFVEDTAVAIDDCAIVAPMGSDARQQEQAVVVEALGRFKKIVQLPALARMDGGDIIVTPEHILVGQSSRTNDAAFEAIKGLFGEQRSVARVPVTGVLHLKTACTYLNEVGFLVNPFGIDRRALPAEARVFETPTDEPSAANMLVFGEHVIMHNDAPTTIARLESLGFRVAALDLSEFAKAEAGPTCLSLILR